MHPDIIGVEPGRSGHLPGRRNGGRMGGMAPPPPHVRPGGGPSGARAGDPPPPPGWIGGQLPGHHPGVLPVKNPDKKKKSGSTSFFGLSRPASKSSGKGLFPSLIQRSTSFTNAHLGAKKS